MRRDYLIGCDLATKYNYAAVVVLERTPLTPEAGPGAVWPHQGLLPGEQPPCSPGSSNAAEDESAPDDDPVQLRVIHAEEVPRGTRYETLAQHVAALVSHPKLRGRCQAVVDGTGVGVAALEIFENQPDLDGILWSVTITPGQRANRKKGLAWSVPKKDLVDAVGVALQRRRLVASTLDGPDMNKLRQQMFSFKRKVDPRKLTPSYEALHESDMDDVVLALCLACWLSSWLPLEDQGEWGEGDPYVISGGAPVVAARSAPSWRNNDQGLGHRPAGNGPPLRAPGPGPGHHGPPH